MRGLQLPSQVATLADSIRELPPASRLLLACAHHDVIVSSGDLVRRGQLLATPNTSLGVPIHAPLAGAVEVGAGQMIIHTANPQRGASEAAVPAADRQLPQPLADTTRAAVIARLRACAVCGMGGAGYPLHAKLAALGTQPLQLLVINAAECDPHLASDRALLRHAPQACAAAVLELRKGLQPARTVVALERNMQPAAAAVLAALPTDVQVDWLPDVYPAGSERQLMARHLGTPLAAGDHPSSHAAVCINIASAVAAHAALTRGEVLLERLVTISYGAPDTPGSARDPVPGVYRVAFGTPLATLLPAGTRALVGGSMMGQTVADLATTTVGAGTTGIHVLHTPGDAPGRSESTPPQPCIRCGDCLPVCPEHLPVETLWRLAETQERRLADAAGVRACLECRACDLVCPSGLPLAATFADTKRHLAADLQAARAAERAHQRHARQQQRLAAQDANPAATRAQRRARLRAGRRGHQATTSVPPAAADTKRLPDD